MSTMSTTRHFRFKHFFQKMFIKRFDFVRKRCSINNATFYQTLLAGDEHGYEQQCQEAHG